MITKKQKTIIGYKFIQENMKSKNGNHIWEIGKWYKEDNIKICQKGFHACIKPRDSLEYVYGDRWFIVEARGEIIYQDNKFVASEMRLIKELDINRIVKRFALFCAKQCLNNYNEVYPKDNRISDCIKGVEDYLDGKIDIDDLIKKRDSAYSAAYSANSAVYSAAYSAYSAVYSAAYSAQNTELLKLIKESEYTPEYIGRLEKNQIFIFGSNERGNHIGGAAKLAKDKFNAKKGVYEGLTGQCYAFPTLNKQMEKRDIKEIKKSVERLVNVIKQNPNKLFLLTRVGCGIAGYKEREMIKLFKKIKLNNLVKPKEW